ncbi:Fucose 4-O-acetylase [Variovorax sp. PBL-H6]|uniref:acyltransferase family protein n=1 Tax=Variovorax sp. PBL-H6 TaxID=434009 RepID=UPI0013189FF6|nr:acyltransferase [Variovorax sp. PBL-H6]VTU27834.1 Fucose 4-O-acetylase [Variovorax sp. PBL-H6]
MPDPRHAVERALPARTAAAAGTRDLHADYLKAAGIVGVVCIHAGLPFQDVYRFGVPVFIGLWAYYLEKALARRASGTHLAYLGQRLAELGVAYIAWTLLYVEKFYDGRWEATPMHTIVGGWFGGYGWSGQYYFVILFQLTLLFPLLRRWVAEVPTLPVIAAGVALNVAAGYWMFENRWISAVGDRLFIYWIPYVAMGVALARGEFGRRPGLGIVAVLLLLAAPIESRLFAEHSPYLTLTVTLASLLLMMSAVAADRAPPRQPGVLGRAVAFIGRNTFAIYVANVAMLEISKSIGFTAFAVSHAGPLGLFAVVAATMFGGLLVGWLLQVLGLGVLVGKR